MSELSGKTAVVTGAGRGIGRGIALALGKAGANVVVASRSKDTVDSVATEIRDAGGEALGVIVDVGERDKVYAMIERATAAYEGLDILVNNAQGFGTRARPLGHTVHGLLEDIDEAEMAFSYETGVLGTFWAMRAAYPYLKARGGSIINFGSTAGENGNAQTGSYNMTKAAVLALTKTAAQEWGKHNITVNIVNPMVESDAYRSFKANQPDEFKEQMREIPLGRLGTPEEAGDLIVFLAGGRARYITGQTIYLDGGHFKGR